MCNIALIVLVIEVKAQIGTVIMAASVWIYMYVF